MTDEQVIAAETGHWYYPDGTPCYQVPYADPRKGMRNTTLSDARKQGLYPSVTKIQKDVMRKPAIERYVQEQLLMAAWQTPKRETTRYIDWKVLVEQRSEQHRERRAMEGTAFHQALDNYLHGIIDPIWKERLILLDKTLDQYGITIQNGRPERSFATTLKGMGYGGKIDLSFEEPLIIDFKTKDSIEKDTKLYHDEQLIQIAAYGAGIYGTKLLQVRGINVFVPMDGAVPQIMEHSGDELLRGLSMWQDLLSFWYTKNKVIPLRRDALGIEPEG